MATLTTASTQDVKRLLELFPLVNIREVWPDLAGTKSEVCQAIAEAGALDQIVNFVDLHVGCCKQHVYVFERADGEPPATPGTILGGELERQGTDHTLYL